MNVYVDINLINNQCGIGYIFSDLPFMYIAKLLCDAWKTGDSCTEYIDAFDVLLENKL